MKRKNMRKKLKKRKKLNQKIKAKVKAKARKKSTTKKRKKEKIGSEKHIRIITIFIKINRENNIIIKSKLRY